MNKNTDATKFEKKSIGNEASKLSLTSASTVSFDRNDTCGFIANDTIVIFSHSHCML